MTTEKSPIEEEMDFWRKCPDLTVNDAVNLIIKFVPDSYWKKSRNPADIIPIYRRITQDIKDFKLYVYIRGTKITCEEDIVRLNEAFHENIVSYEEYLYSSWWDKGKIVSVDLKSWLAEKGIPSEFFCVTITEDEPVKSDKVNTTDTPSQTAANSSAPIVPTHPSTEEQQTHTPVTIPSALWKGKPYASVRNAMRPKGDYAGFSDAVIAHVLFYWCELKNKTELGRLLGKPGQDDSSYRRLTARLLKEAASLTITHD